MFPFMLLILLIILVATVLVVSMRVVAPHEAVIIERLGKYHSTLHQGLHFAFPFIDSSRKIELQPSLNNRRKTERIPLRESVFELHLEPLTTQDSTNTSLDLLVYFQITDPVKVVYETDSLPTVMTEFLRKQLREIIGKIAWENIPSSREQMRETLQNNIQDTFVVWGLRLSRVELLGIENIDR